MYFVLLRAPRKIGKTNWATLENKEFTYLLTLQSTKHEPEGQRKKKMDEPVITLKQLNGAYMFVGLL